MSTASSSGLKAFSQHGFNQAGDNASQVYGSCPFCRKKSHFYIGKDNHAFSCKSCQRAGGFESFLRQVGEEAAKNFTGKSAIELSQERGIPLSVLRRFNVGWWAVSGKYTLPIVRSDGTGKIWDLRHCRKEKYQLMSTTSCQVGLLGWERFGLFDEVWICEGEWDAMILDEVFRVEQVNALSIGNPGAGTFKGEWAQSFDGKRVVVAYDNDEPGRTGALKVYNALQPIARKLSFVHWEKDKSEGYDIRDLWKDTGKKTRTVFNQLSTTLQPYPPGVDVKQTKTKTAQPQLGGNGLPADEVYKRFRKWLHLPDSVLGALDVVFGSAIANRMPGDPLWVFLIAPPGGFKTEPLLSLDAAPNVLSASSMSPPAWISGAQFAGGGDPSILARFQGTHDKMLVIKDFTTILNMNQQNREEIFGILRDIYDGKCEKAFGNGVFRRYLCTFGILAGVTPAIEQYIENSASLGERFLGYWTPIPRGPRERRDYLKAARRNVGKEFILRKELSETAKEALSFDFLDKVGIPKISDKMDDRILNAAQFTSMMRASISRDSYSKEVKRRPFTELGTRLVKQFTKLAMGIAMFHRRKKISEHEYEIIKHISRGSVPSVRLDYLRAMWSDRKKVWASKEVSDIVGLPDFPTGGRTMENLELLGALRKVQRDGFGAKAAWVIDEEFLETLEGGGILNGT